jgi:hypothetical protein
MAGDLVKSGPYARCAQKKGHAMDVTTSISPQARSRERAAIRFIVLIGFASLFGYMAYEGAHSVVGPYLAMLGASATVVGIAAGLGAAVGSTANAIVTAPPAACFIRSLTSHGSWAAPFAE